MRNNGKKLEIEKRRLDVARVYSQGLHEQLEIAEKLGISQPTISRDLKVLKKRWMKEAVEDIDQAKGEVLREIQEARRVAWEGYEKSLDDFKSKIIKGRGLGKDSQGKTTGESIEQTIKTEDRNGDPRFLEVVMKCIDRRCKLMGLDAPDKHEHTGKGGGPIQIEEQRAAVEERLKNDPDLAKRLKDAIGG